MKNGHPQLKTMDRASGGQRPSGRCPSQGGARVLGHSEEGPSSPSAWDALGGLGEQKVLRGKLPSQGTAVQTHLPANIDSFN